MKTAIFISTRFYGIYSSRLPHLDFFSNKGFRVVVMGRSDKHLDGLDRSRYEFIEIPFPDNFNVLNWKKCIRIMSQEFKRLQPDVIVVFNSLPIILTSICSLKKKASRIMVFTGSGSYFNWTGIKGWIRDSIFRKILKNDQTTYVFQNPEDREFFIDRGLTHGDKSLLIKSSGVDTKRFPRKNSFKKDFPFHVALVGRLLVEKGVNDYLNAIEILTERYPGKFKFILAGEYYGNRSGSLNHDKIKELEEKAHLNYQGYIEDMPDFFSQLDIFVYPSYYPEGVPRVCLEASAVGLPVITTTSRGCNLTVENGKTGFLIEPKSVSQLVESLEYFAKNPSELEAFSINSAKFARENFDKTIIDKKYFDLYDEQI